MAKQTAGSKSRLSAFALSTSKPTYDDGVLYVVASADGAQLRSRGSGDHSVASGSAQEIVMLAEQMSALHPERKPRRAHS